MNESQTLKSAVIKTLAIVGFLITIGVLLFLIVEGIKRAPGAFSSLSGVMSSLQTEKPVTELVIKTEKDVVNSNESFQISWTDVKEDGEYQFSYACADGITLEVRSADGSLMPVKCTDTLTLPKNVQGLFLSTVSKEMRFTDVVLTVSFANTEKTKSLKGTTKIAIVNATIPVGETVTQAPTKKKETPSTATEVTYPRSNPNGFTDLQMSILGSGRMQNGNFAFAQTYDENANNALRFDVKNIGTKVSNNWTFSVTLPDGEVYSSQTQTALYPGDHIVFTLGFYLDKNGDDSVTLSPTLYTQGDTNLSNNTSVLRVKVVN